MDRDARKQRGERPFVFTNLKSGIGIDFVCDFLISTGGLEARLSDNARAAAGGD